MEISPQENFSVALSMNNYMNFSDLDGVYMGVVPMEKSVRIFLNFLRLIFDLWPTGIQ